VSAASVSPPPHSPNDRLFAAASSLRDLVNVFNDRHLDDDLLDAVTSAAEQLTAQIGEAEPWDRQAALEAGLQASETVEGRRTGFPHRAIAGPANPAANPMPLSYDYDEGIVTTEITLHPMHVGAPGRGHGGVLAGVFDELAGAAPRLVGTMGVTAQLCINYRNPIPLGDPLTLRAWVDRHEGRKVFVKGDAHRDHDLIADIEALFIVIDYAAIDTSGGARH
jgi:acyl-coenzyme A thioesterase PaaI-like protein